MAVNVSPRRRKLQTSTPSHTHALISQLNGRTAQLVLQYSCLFSRGVLMPVPMSASQLVELGELHPTRRMDGETEGERADQKGCFNTLHEYTHPYHVGYAAGFSHPNPHCRTCHLTATLPLALSKRAACLYIAAGRLWLTLFNTFSLQ